MRDERLEYLSDEVRKGIPVNFNEALEVIEYQEALKLKRNRSIWKKLSDWYHNVTETGETCEPKK